MRLVYDYKSNLCDYYVTLNILENIRAHKCLRLHMFSLRDLSHLINIFSNKNG